MLILKKVAVTGGIASGKTSVCHLLESYGAYVIDADRIVHQLLSSNSIIGQQVVSLLGPSVLDQGKLNRSKIAEIVFSDPKKLQLLEKIIHPVVLDEINNSYQRISKENKHSLFVAEIPLLYESESEKFFDSVIVVIADENLSKERFQKKTGYLSDEFNRRTARQLHPQQKAASANYVIFNNGNFDELKNQVKKIYSLLVQQSNT